MTLRRMIQSGQDLEDNPDNLSVELNRELGFHLPGTANQDDFYIINASNTCHPTETPNILWDYVKIPIVASNADPDISQTLNIDLYGLTTDGELHYIGSEPIELAPSTNINYNSMFNLRGCSSVPGLHSLYGSVALPSNLLTDNQATGTDTLANTTGFTGRNASVASSNTYARSGSRSIYTVTSGATYPEGIDLDYATVSPNTTYILHFWARGSGNLRAQINEYNGGTFLSNTYGTSQALSTDEWRKFYVYVTTSGSTNRIVPSLYTPSQQSVTVYADEFYLATGSDSTNGYMNSSGDYIRAKLYLPSAYKNFESIYIRKSWMDSTFTQRKTKTYNPASVNMADVVLYYPKDFETGMNADFSDVRFSWFDGITELPYYLNTYTASTIGNFYIRVPLSNNESSNNLLVYYDNDTATSTSSGQSTFWYFDDFEDNMYGAGRTSPYQRWYPAAGGAGALAIESSSPIKGTYSLKFNAPGTTSYANYIRNDWFSQPAQTYDVHSGGESYTVEYDFKPVTISGTYSPAIFLWYPYYVDTNNFLLVETYYSGGYQKLAITRRQGGTLTGLATANISASKLSSGTVYPVKVQINRYPTTMNITATLGSTSVSASAINHTYMDNPVKGGMGINESSTMVMDNFRTYQYGTPTWGSLSTVETQLSGSVDEVPDENSNIVYMTVPYDWITKNYGYIEYNKHGEATVYSKPAPINNNGILKLLYENLDNYNALRVAVNGEVNGNFSFNIPSIEYGYII